MMREGFINQCSFMFRPLDDVWTVRDGEVVREVTDALVMALSVVSMPAYPQTTAEARSIAEGLLSDAKPTIAKDIEDDGGAPEDSSDTPGAGVRTYVFAGKAMTFPNSKKEASQ
jgi:hypothetical protein